MYSLELYKLYSTEIFRAKVIKGKALGERILLKTIMLNHFNFPQFLKDC